MTPSSSPHPGLRFIPREALGAVTPWKFGAVDGSDLIAPAPAPEPVAQIPVGIDTAAQQALIEQARAEAHAEGFAQGQEQTAAAWQRRMEEYLAGQGRAAATRLQALLQTLDASLSALQQQMAQQLLELACDIARQGLRQELSVNPRSLLPVVRQALAMLGTEGRPATVRLNPADPQARAQPLRGAGERGWRRGGGRVAMPRACPGSPTPPCLPAAAWWRSPAPWSMAASTSAGSGPSRRWVCSRRGRKARQVMAMSVERPGAWTRFMAEARARMAEGVPLESSGTLTRLTGLVLEAVGLRVPVGAQCLVGMPGQAPVLAEVVGFSGERTFLMPAGDAHGLCSGARVLPCAPDMPGPVWGEPPRPIRRTGVLRLPMGNGLLGRVVDAQGLPLDHRGPVQDTVLAPMARDRINAMERDPVRQ